jgi:hypothetical protein
MGLRGRLKRLERDAREEIMVIPQQDGMERHFPRSAGMEAFVNLVDRMGAGEEAPPEYPLLAAARNSSEPKWSRSFYATSSEGWTDPREHSEPQWCGRCGRPTEVVVTWDGLRRPGGDLPPDAA